MYGETTLASGEKRIRDSGEPYQLKIFSDNHFSYVHLNQEGLYSGASAGTYRLEGNRYIETHLYGTNEKLVETSVTVAWEYEVDGDMLIMSGPLSCVDGDGNDIMNEIFGDTKSLLERRRRAKVSDM